MNKLLITGGVWDEESIGDSVIGARFSKAILLELCLKTGKQTPLLEYKTPKKQLPPDYTNIAFLAMQKRDNELILTTRTEILFFSYPDLRLQRIVSEPCFNDNHHLYKKGDELYAVCTGLDMVAKYDLNKNKIVDKIPIVENGNFSKYDPSIDYRKVYSTKPHKSHPNYIFEIDGEIWVTRFEQGDCVNLYNPQQSITIAEGCRIHDGYFCKYNKMLYFTMVKGELIVYDWYKKSIAERINLNVLDGRSADSYLSWCRGVYVVGDVAYVGFTAIRKTSDAKNILGFADTTSAPHEHKGRLTRIAAYDLKKREKISEHILETSLIGGVFDIKGA